MEKQETAVSYLRGVLEYMQDGGKLSSIDATVSEALRLHAAELGSPGSPSVKAAALRDAVNSVRPQYNTLYADAVFRDLEEVARSLGS